MFGVCVCGGGVPGLQMAVGTASRTVLPGQAFCAHSTRMLRQPVLPNLSSGKILVNFKPAIRHLERHVDYSMPASREDPPGERECLNPQLLQIEGALLSSSLGLCSGMGDLPGG